MSLFSCISIGKFVFEIIDMHLSALSLKLSFSFGNNTNGNIKINIKKLHILNILFISYFSTVTENAPVAEYPDIEKECV